MSFDVLANLVVGIVIAVGLSCLVDAVLDRTVRIRTRVKRHTHARIGPDAACPFEERDDLLG